MAALYQRLFGFEIVAIAYLAALTVAAILSDAARRRRARAIRVAVATIGLVLVSAGTSATARGWIAHVYLLMAYWLPALLVVRSPNAAFEAWLIRSDAAWSRWITKLPAPAVTLLELMYMSCYPFVPFAFAVVWMLGGVEDVDRFWTASLVAGCVCYGSLPWIVTRPPRAHAADRQPGAAVSRPAVRRLNVAVLARASHGLNTFPSGHVAVSVAGALIVSSVSWPLGLVFMAVALGIAGGAVVGRYHYFVDVLIGTLVGVLAAWLAT